MQSKSASVAEYLASLPADRRATLEAVRKVIKANLDGYEEGMQYGMIGYYVPHESYPAGYHCDPKQPLPFGGLASQKQKCSLHLMGLYVGDGANELTRWFQQAWAKTGKKLDMGKACIRFKDVDDLALDVIGEAIRRMPAKTYVARYEAVLAGTKTGAARAKTAKKAAATTKKPTGRKARSK